jgi:hypothetical protein
MSNLATRLTCITISLEHGESPRFSFSALSREDVGWSKTASPVRAALALKLGVHPCPLRLCCCAVSKHLPAPLAFFWWELPRVWPTPTNVSRAHTRQSIGAHGVWWMAHQGRADFSRQSGPTTDVRAIGDAHFLCTVDRIATSRRAMGNRHRLSALSAGARVRRLHRNAFVPHGLAVVPCSRLVHAFSLKTRIYEPAWITSELVATLERPCTFTTPVALGTSTP